MLAKAELNPAVKLRIARVGEAPLPSDEAWRDLAMKATEPNPFFEHWFLKPALRHLTSGSPIWVAQLWEGDLLCGLMPLSVRDRYGRMPVRTVGNWAHYQCFMGTPLIAEGYETAFWRALLSALDEADWALGFLSVSGLLPEGPVDRGLIAAAQALGRPCPVVHRHERAMLRSDLSAEAYLEAHVRAKKRKEWRRLENRLSDLGAVEFETLNDASELPAWCAAFLALEAAGWKGRDGAALGNRPETEGFFTAMMAGALAAGALEFQRLTLDNRPIAMLVNFVTAPGSWSFKIAYDEELARFSPGVMIELRNLTRVLRNPDIDWMDSCAVEGHPMIDSLWAERRSIVQVSVPLKGARRALAWKACRAAETASAALKSMWSKG